jgi:hypothetical protein
MSNRSLEREIAFVQVKEAYRRFHQSLERSGELPYRSTRSGMWAVTGIEELYGAFCHFALERYAHMADLGSGDGRAVLLGSLFTRATGYEIDGELYRTSLAIRDELNLTRAGFYHQDYLEADLSPYDLLYLYPDKPFSLLEQKLAATWRGRLLVRGHHFPPCRFRKIAESSRAAGRFVLYETP